MIKECLQKGKVWSHARNRNGSGCALAKWLESARAGNNIESLSYSAKKWKFRLGDLAFLLSQNYEAVSNPTTRKVSRGKNREDYERSSHKSTPGLKTVSRGNKGWVSSNT